MIACTRRWWFALTVAVALGTPALAAEPPAGNVLFVLIDGLRWQEVFRGAEEDLIDKEKGGVADVAAVRTAYWRDTPEARREALLPFLWSVVSKHGQLWGNQDRGSVMRVANGLNFSYPGYSEMLVGSGDPRIDSNDKKPNPNVTVLEWLHAKPAFTGKVAAFATWDVVPFILNRERSGLLVNAGSEPLTGVDTPEVRLLNRLKAEIPYRWAGCPYDALAFYTALDYLKHARPRVLYLAFGETDEFGHGGRYDSYLDSARRNDAYLRMLWETAQSLPEYRDKTTLIVVTDHGRGDGPQGWRNHGKDTQGCENVWCAILGPGTPPRGEIAAVEPITLSQVAATLAAALGEDFRAEIANAAPPIAGAVTTRGHGGSTIGDHVRQRRAGARDVRDGTAR